MPFNITNTLRTLQDFVAKTGSFSGIIIGEPAKIAAGEQLSAAIYMEEARVVELTLGTTIEVHTATLRIYRKALTDPPGDAELEIAVAVQKLLSDILADADLGASIRAIDVGGIYGAAVGTKWGYIELGGVIYRVADITIPLIVDDSATTTI